jgi:hypothetical protein
VELMPRTHSYPIVGEKEAIDALQGGVFSLVAPCEEPPIEMSLLEQGSVQEVAKLPHKAAIHAIIILILSVVNHVEVPSNKPWSDTNMS